VPNSNRQQTDGVTEIPSPLALESEVFEKIVFYYGIILFQIIIATL
jgi:hypothetical protein